MSNKLKDAPIFYKNRADRFEAEVKKLTMELAESQKARARLEDELRRLKRKNVVGKGQIAVNVSALREIFVAIWNRKLNWLEKRYASQHLADLLGEPDVNVAKWIDENRITN